MSTFEPNGPYQNNQETLIQQFTQCIFSIIEENKKGLLLEGVVVVNETQTKKLLLSYLPGTDTLSSKIVFSASGEEYNEAGILLLEKFPHDSSTSIQYLVKDDAGGFIGLLRLLGSLAYNFKLKEISNT